MMKVTTAILSVAVYAPAAFPGAPVEWVFDGSLPPGVTLDRSTSRHNEAGILLPGNTPRFAPRAVSEEGAEFITALDQSQQILAAQALDDGRTATLVRYFNTVYLTFDTPGISPSVDRIVPHPNIAPRFGNSAIWGLPSGGEIFEDGTVLIFTNGSIPDLRAMAIRTTVTDFALEQGMTLARTSPYAPPPGWGTTQSPPWFTRKTYLPNLDNVISTIAEYRGNGLTSSAYPGDGRSLGFGSSDGGHTWQRLIDTDDPLLGRNLVITAKHLHHLEPFEWWDDIQQQWNIGAIGCLGDGPTASGSVAVFSDGPTFPDPDVTGQYPTLYRYKAIGRDMLTDIFPLDSSLSPGSPLRYLLGPDSATTGVIEATIDLTEQTDRFLFRPATSFVLRNNNLNTLCAWPYIFQYNRLPNNSIIAPTFEFTDRLDPNGMWASDTTGEHWTTVHQVNNSGFTGVIPISSDVFWTFKRKNLQITTELWSLEPPIVQQSLLLSPAAQDAATDDFFVPSLVLSSTTGQVAPPDQLPADTTIMHLQSSVIPAGTWLDNHTLHLISAQEGQLVSFVTWVKPGRKDLSAPSFRIIPQFEMTDGSLLTTAIDRVTLDANDWTRIVSTRRIPAGDIRGIRFKCRLSEDASPSAPFDYYFTLPQIVFSEQPIVHHVPASTSVAADQLSVDLPPLGAEWSVQIDATEELAFVTSLVDSTDDDITVESRSNSVNDWQGVASILRLSPNFTPTPTFPIDSDPHDVVMPTQTRLTIVMSQPDDVLKMYVRRGMGDTNGVAVQTTPFTPTELRMGTPDFSRVFQGALHRIRVWPNTALDLGPAPFIEHCPNDANDDGSIDVNDISYILFRLGNTGDPGTLDGDINDDGIVDVNDISSVLFYLGPCPTP